jgi:hypothetical protein
MRLILAVPIADTLRTLMLCDREHQIVGPCSTLMKPTTMLQTLKGPLTDKGFLVTELSGALHDMTPLDPVNDL